VVVSRHWWPVVGGAVTERDQIERECESERAKEGERDRTREWES
jgi:hypothetical protein